MRCFERDRKKRLKSCVAFFVTVVTLALTGCFKPSPHANSDAATFNASTVEGSAQIENLIDGFSLPKSKLFNFHVCLEHRRTKSPAVGESFRIEGGDRVAAVRGDKDGCVQWSESVAFEITADEHYVELRRRVIATGGHSGSVELRMAINPWNISGSSPAVVDLSKTKLPDGDVVPVEAGSDALQGKLANASAEKAKLVVEKVIIDGPAAKVSASGYVRSMILTMDTALMVRDLKQKSAVLDIKQGIFKLEATLVEATVAGGHENETALYDAQGTVQTRIEDGLIRARFTGRIRHKSDRVLLALRVSPLGALSDVRAFEALYDIGSPGDFIGSSSLVAAMKASNVKGDFGYLSYLTAIKALDATTLKPVRFDSPAASSGHGASGGSPPPASSDTEEGPGRLGSFETGPITMSLKSIRPRDDGNTRRTVLYDAKVCLTDTSKGGRPAIGVPFRIFVGENEQKRPVACQGVENGKSVPVACVGSALPSMEGCVTWEGSITHDYYQSETYFLLPVTIRHDASGFEEKRIVAINPWERFGFARDTLLNPEILNEVQDRSAKPAILNINEFQFQRIGRRGYAVDPYLNRKTIVPARVSFNPLALRYSSLYGGKSQPPEPLRPGIYLFRSVLHVPSQGVDGPVDLITPMVGLSRLVKVEGPTVKVDLEFAVPDDSTMISRGNFVFELWPVDESKLTDEERETVSYKRGPLESLINPNAHLVSSTYVGPLWIKAELGGANVVTTKDLAVSGGRFHPALSDEDRKRIGDVLANATVPQLIARAQDLERQYHIVMSERRTLQNFVKSERLDYVPLYNEELIASQMPGVLDGNIALPGKNVARFLVDALNLKMNGILRDPFVPKGEGTYSVRELLDLVEGRRAFDPNLGTRMCYLFFEVMMDRMSADLIRGLDRFRPQMNYWVRACAESQQVMKMPPREVFSFERKLRVFNVDPQAWSSSSRSFYLATAGEVTFSGSDTQSQSYSGGVAPSGPLSVWLAAKAAADKVAFSVPSMIVSGLSGGTQWSWVSQSSVGKGFAVEVGTSMTGTRRDLTFKLNRYESCAVVRVNPHFILSFQAAAPRMHNADVKTLLKSGAMMTKQAKQKFYDMMERGLLICTGLERRQPWEVKERYITFVHEGLKEEATDIGDSSSQPWFLTVRGTRDYAHLLDLMKADVNFNSAKKSDIDLGSISIDNVDRAYIGFTPSAPGWYTLDPLIMGEPSSW